MPDFSTYDGWDDDLAPSPAGYRRQIVLRFLLGAMTLLTGVLLVGLMVVDLPAASQIEIVTKPPGATVLIDGDPLELTTPVKVGLRPRRYDFEVRRQGYRTEQFLLDVPEGAKPARKTIPLIPSSPSQARLH